MEASKISFIDAFKLAIAFAVTAAAFMILSAISDVFLILLAAVIFAIALDRPIDRLVARKIPRSVATIILYATALVVIALLLYWLLPPLAHEMRNFAVSYPTYLEGLLGQQEATQLEATGYLRSAAEAVTASSQAIIGTIFRISGGLASFLSIFFISMFLNIQRRGVRSFVFPFVPVRHKTSATAFFEKVQARLSMWLWGKTLSSVMVGGVVFAGLLALDIPYAVLLSILAVLLNYIPYAGPTVAAIPAAMLGAVQSPWQGILVLVLYFVANVILESLALPLIMKHTIRMNPVILILSVIVGARLGGILGIIIAIPAAAIIYLALDEYVARRKMAMQVTG